MYIKTTIALAESALNKKISEPRVRRSKLEQELDAENKDYERYKHLPWYAKEKLLEVRDRHDAHYWRVQEFKSYFKKTDLAVLELQNRIARLNDSVDGFVYVNVEE